MDEKTKKVNELNDWFKVNKEAMLTARTALQKINMSSHFHLAYALTYLRMAEEDLDCDYKDKLALIDGD
jgi:hypothetical protein